MTTISPELTGDEKLRLMEHRLEAFAKLPDLLHIQCAYCHSVLDFSDVNNPPQDCCPKFTLAVMAIVHRQKMKEKFAVANRIADAWNEMVEKGPVH